MWKFIVTFAMFNVALRLLDGFNLDERNAKIINGSSVGGYFGFSVAIIEANGVYVGAPKANDTNLPTILEPGTVSKCPISQGQVGACDAFTIDSVTAKDSYSFDGSTRHFTHEKSGQWMGGSLAVRPNRDSKAGIVACAPRWGNKMPDRNETFMLGMCYVIPKDLTPINIIKLPALVNGAKYTYKSADNTTKHNWAMAGYGINAHYTSEETSLLFGAPGLKDWTGGFVNVNLATAGLRGTVSESDLELVNETYSSLAGFAITSGFYSNHASPQEYFVVGIPRANLTGQVKIFMSKQTSYSLQRPSLVINAVDHKAEDLPMNSYFGGSLLTEDVNADGIDDLLVGAPLYSPDGRKESVDLGPSFYT